MRLFKLCFLSLLISLTQHVIGQVVKKDAKLVDQPKSKLPGDVKKGQTVKVLQRKGFWFQIEVGGKKGWVKATWLSLIRKVAV